MKQYRWQTIFYLTMVFLCTPCITKTGNLSSDAPADAAHTVNFYGTLKDHQKEAEVDFIAIGGKTEKIIFYNAPEKGADGKYPDVDPTSNKASVDLNEITSFELKFPEKPSDNEVKLQNRSYLLITATTIADKKREYLIEATRKVTCKEISLVQDKVLEEERELTFAHIKKLTILGYTSGNRVQVKALVTVNPGKADSVKEANTLLDGIENNIKNLPKDNPSLLEQMKKSTLQMLKSLRATLQKILDMIK